MMDPEIFVFEDVEWQTTPPPDRYPVPARFVGDLDIGAELTIGIPGRYFLDGQILLRREHEWHSLHADEVPREAIGVCAPIHYWTWRSYSDRVPIMQWWPLEHAWVYQDAVAPNGPAHAGLREPAPERTWLDRVRPGVDEPPVLHSVPAREAGALTGRTLRSRNAAGDWFWFIGASEPFDHDGDICVQTVPQPHWWIHQVAYRPDLQDKVRTVPLHRLFAYS